jgi:hypothetical protein
MDKETFEALKRIIETLGKLFDTDKKINDIFTAYDIDLLEQWIKEAEKEKPSTCQKAEDWINCSRCRQLEGMYEVPEQEYHD